MKIKLITDSASDLPLSYIKDNNIDYVSLEVNINGEFIIDDFGQTLKYEYFYQLMRDGNTPSTSLVNTHTFEQKFKEYLNDYAIIYIGLSAALSGTVGNAHTARQNLLTEYPDADITIIDSKSGSLGIGALVYYANEMVQAGKDKEDIVEWLNTHNTKLIHEFTVDSLAHLKRGGRISGTAATVGSLLNIKPMLYLDDEGKVTPGVKVKGRKKALKYMLNQLSEKAVDLEKQTLFISHGNCLEEALALKEMILMEHKVKDVMITHVGAIIGCHVGPGAMLLAYLGSQR